jgi:Tfp pilus assembly protein PilF
MAIIATILPIFFALLAILNFILFILVLIKQFKAGVLKGILGIITCGLFTFIWGWIKHKQLEITKIMLIWTATTVIPFLLQIVLIFAGVGMFMADFANMTSLIPPPPPPVVQKRVMKPAPKIQPKAPMRKAAPVPAKSPAPKATVDYAFEMKKVEALLKLNDKNGDAFYNRGWLYEYKGDLLMAEKDYSKAIELDQKDGDAYFNRGLIYVKAKKYDQAINDFSEVIKRQPHAAAAFCNRGNAHFQKGAMDLALKDYDAGLKIDPKDGDLYYNRALVYLASQDRAKAEADLRRAADLGHDKAGAHLKLPPAKAPGPDAGAGKTAGVEATDVK